MTEAMRIDIKKNTDQLNFEDFLGGVTRVVTIAGVERGRKEAQYDIAIEGDDRYWRPPPTVLKQLKLAYGENGADWVGKKAMLYGDPEVKMAGKKVGGIRVSHLSHLDGPLSAPLIVTRGQTAVFTVQPLTPELIKAAYQAEWRTADPDRRKVIEAEVAALSGTKPPPAGQTDPENPPTPDPADEVQP